LKKTRANIWLFELSKLKQQENNFFRALGTNTSEKQISTTLNRKKVVQNVSPDKNK